MDDKKQNKSTHKRPFRWLRRLGRVMLGILIFLVLLVLFIRSPWGQSIIVDRLVAYIEGKTGTEVQVEKLFLTFDGNLQADGVYLSDKKGDTLIYSKSLEASIPLQPFISSGAINIDEVYWEGLVARINRQDTINGFNYEFLLDVFATAPDTTTASEPFQMDFGNARLQDFDITFKDEVEKIDASAQFELFELEMNQLDLIEMRVDVDQIALKDAQIHYDQYGVPASLRSDSVQVAKADPDPSPNTDTTLAEALNDEADNSPMPLLQVGSLNLDQVVFTFNSQPEGLQIDTDIHKLESAIPKADLQEQEIQVSYLNLDDSKVEVRMNETTPSSNMQQNETPAFVWPDYKVRIAETHLNNNRFFYSLNGAQPQPGVFNPYAISLSDINLSASEMNLSERRIAAKVQELNLQEASGLNVYRFSVDFEMTDQQMSAQSLSARINNSSLQGRARLAYQSMNQLIEQPLEISMSANIARYNIDLKDIYRFQPDLKQNEYFQELSQRPITGELSASGTTQNLNIESLNLNWGAQTRLTTSGQLANIMEVENLTFDLNETELVANRADLLPFINEEELGISLPEAFAFTGKAEGQINDITGSGKLTTSKGDLVIDGSFNNQEGIAFDVDLKATEVALGSILNNPSLGTLTLNLDASGSGESIEQLDAQVDATVTRFAYNEYQINNLPIRASFDNGTGTLTADYKDENLNAGLDAQIELDSVATKAVVDLNVEGVDLKAFGLTTRKVKAAGQLNARFVGNMETYTIDSEITDGITVYDNQSYLLGRLGIDAYVQPDSTSVEVANKMLDLKLRSNASPAQLATAIQQHLDNYLREEAVRDTTRPLVVMSVEGTLKPAPILRDVIVPDLESLDTVQISMDFNERKRKLNTDIIAPFIRYAGSEIDSLIVQSRSDQDDLSFNLGFSKLSAGVLNLKQTDIQGRVSQNQLFLDFDSYDGQERLIHFGSTLSRKQDENMVDNLIFNLSLEDLILNKQAWTIPENNEMAYGAQKIKFSNFLLSNGAQSIELRSDLPDIPKDHVALLLDNFKLQSILSYLNPDEKLASGTVNGNLILEEVLGNMGFEADLTITDFEALEVPLGTMTLDADYVTNNRYNMDLDIEGAAVSLQLAGDYQAAQPAAQLNLDLDIDRLNMETIAGFSNEFLEDGSGYLSGHLDVTGTTLEPEYNGAIQFNNAGINIAMLNTKFYMDNEEVQVNNEAIILNDFVIDDANRNAFHIDGKIGTEDWLNPNFDLRLNAEDFMALNSSAEDNDLYYGKAVFDVSASITGDLEVPVVDMTLNVEEETDFTYVVPPTELDIVQRDGIVQFVNKENPDAILTQTEEESATLTGFDITAGLKIGNGATVNIIVDPNTGDQLQVSGSGDLRFNMSPNGRMTLTGRYEIDDGFYELSLYEVVSRRFELAKGGSVSWSGDPFDATLDVRAIYRVETSASALMAPQTSGADVSTKNRFRQELPFLVYLNVNGELMQPEIDFNLDLPESEQGAIGGQVYGRIQQLNNQEQELNKQVFSLIVLNRFFPTSGADGSSGGTTTIARDNLNQALSDQLNQFGGKLFGNAGVDVSFGLDTFTDYQGSNPQTRTQLDVTASKKLLDDRLIVSVGSEVDLEGSAPEGQETPILGNVSIQYLLTPQGRWKLKGFRRNQYDNVIDGQLIVSGIALIFTREFNEFAQLFGSTVEEATEEQKNKVEE